MPTTTYLLESIYAFHDDNNKRNMYVCRWQHCEWVEPFLPYVRSYEPYIHNRNNASAIKTQVAEGGLKRNYYT
jgi:hypothetical protein